MHLIDAFFAWHRKHHVTGVEAMIDACPDSGCLAMSFIASSAHTFCPVDALSRSTFDTCRVALRPSLVGKVPQRVFTSRQYLKVRNVVVHPVVVDVVDNLFAPKNPTEVAFHHVPMLWNVSTDCSRMMRKVDEDVATANDAAAVPCRVSFATMMRAETCRRAITAPAASDDIRCDFKRFPAGGILAGADNSDTLSGHLTGLSLGAIPRTATTVAGFIHASILPSTSHKPCTRRCV